MRLYVDANVFIYGTEVFDPSYTTTSRTLLNFIREGRMVGCTSEMTMAELFAPRRDGASLQPGLRDAYTLGLERDFTLVPVARHILERTTDVRETVSMKLPDAIHCAAELATACDVMITADARLSRCRQIDVIAPDADGLRSLLSRLNP